MTLLRSTWPRAIGAAVLLLALWVLPAPVSAQEEEVEFYSEIRITQPVTTYGQPDPTADVQELLPAGTVLRLLVGPMHRRTTMNGMTSVAWVEVAMPDGRTLGWARLTDLTLGTTPLLEPVTAMP